MKTIPSTCWPNRQTPSFTTPVSVTSLSHSTPGYKSLTFDDMRSTSWNRHPIAEIHGKPPSPTITAHNTILIHSGSAHTHTSIRPSSRSKRTIELCQTSVSHLETLLTLVMQRFIVRQLYLKCVADFNKTSYRRSRTHNGNITRAACVRRQNDLVP